jgi:hypothetical protein
LNRPALSKQADKHSASGRDKLQTLVVKSPLTQLLNRKSELRDVPRGNQTARRFGIARSAASINLVAQNGKSNRKIDFLGGKA